jgi:hypothetical protein
LDGAQEELVVSLRQRLFPLVETRLAVVLGLTASVSSIVAPISNSSTGGLLSIGRQALLRQNVVPLLFALFLPVALWTLCAVGGFVAARRERAVFGFLVGIIAIAWCFSALYLFLPTQPLPVVSAQRVHATAIAALINGIVALVVVLIVALLSSRGVRTPVAAEAEGGRRRAGGWLAFVLGLDAAHEPATRRLVAWALAFVASASTATFGLAWLGVRGWQADIVRLALLVALTFAAVHWRAAPRTLWLPGTLSAVVSSSASLALALAAYLAGPRIPGDAPERLVASMQALQRSALVSSFQHALVLVAQVALVLVVVALATRRLEPRPADDGPADGI